MNKFRTVLISLLFALIMHVVAQDDVIEITYWRSLAGPRGEAQEELARRFNASQDRIRVDVQFQGSYGELEQRLLAGLAARTLPDVVMLCDTCMPSFAREGVLLPLDELLDANENPTRADFIGRILDGGKVDGTLYIIPFAASTPILFYNPEMLAEAGVSVPETWNELFSVSQTITEHFGGDVVGLTFSPTLWWLQSHFWSEGGEVSGEEFATYIDSEIWTNALTQWRDLVHVHQAGRIPSAAEGGTFADFANRRAAMMISSTANITSTFEQVAEFTPATAFLPGGQAGNVVPTGGAGLGIIAGLDEARTAAAWEFISFMTSAESNAFFAQETGYMPYTNRAVEAMQEFLEANPEWETSVTQLDFARNQSELSGLRDARAVLEEYLERIFVGGEDPATVLPQAQMDVQAAIDLMGLR
jgi:sn-glycerol 3-phosphate transport system substrate-binding protein